MDIKLLRIMPLPACLFLQILMNVLKVLMLVIKCATILKGHILARALRVTPSKITGHAKVGQYYW